MIKVAVACSLAIFATSTQASLWEDLIDTTPAGLVRQSQDRPGDWTSFWSDTKEGYEQIMKSGADTLVIPTYTSHPKWAWDDTVEQNGLPFGTGVARKLIDSKGNERMMFAVAFVDSNYQVEPMVGYAWFARYPIGNTGFDVGAGYIAGITMREDYLWLPLPLPLPAAKVGYKDISFYGTWIPFTNVGFFYTTITVDNASKRLDPLPTDSPWVKNPNLLYASAGIQYADNGTESASPNTIHHAGSWGVGLRHYSARNWQTDLKYKKARHEVRNAIDKTSEKMDVELASLTISYNIDTTRDFRFFAGAGFGWTHASSSKGSDNSIHPVTTLGFTWAFTDKLHLTGSMDTSFARLTGVTPGRDDGYVMKPMPTDFNLGLGLAF